MIGRPDIVITIRPEHPNDFDALRDFVRTAFATAARSDGDESAFVDRLRASEAYIPELALIAEADGRMLGHVVLTRIFIERDTDGPIPALMLAPLSVLAEERKRGIGGELVREVVARAEALGHRVVVLVGSPAYYGRFGFVPASNFGLVNTNGYEDWAFQVLEIVPGTLTATGGRVTFPS